MLEGDHGLGPRETEPPTALTSSCPEAQGERRSGTAVIVDTQSPAGAGTAGRREAAGGLGAGAAGRAQEAPVSPFLGLRPRFKLTAKCPGRLLPSFGG